MTANELRIGNLIYDDRKSEVQVYSLDTEINHDDLTSQYAGILLTEEWLLKLCFEQGYNDSFFKIKLSASELHINPDNGVVWIYNPVGEAFNNPQLIEFVHQLQNLYFALTGKELC